MAATSVTRPRLWQRLAQSALVLVGALGLVPVVTKPPGYEFGYAVAGMVIAAVGLILTQKRPANGIGWALLGAWALDGLFNIAGAAGDHAIATGDFTSWWAWMAGWLPSWMFGPLLFLAVTLPLLIFPEGFASRRWRLVGGVGAAATLAFVVCGMVSPVLAIGYNLDGDQTVALHNPLSPPFLSGAGTSDDWLLRNVALATIVVVTVVAAIGIAVRAYRAVGVERLQFRWVGFACVMLVLLLALTTLFPDSTAVGKLIWALALVLIPVSMGIAILRFHLYDIDRVISRTTSYAIVTGLLLAVYAVIVTSASRLLHTDSPLVVAGATLAAAALARPALRRVQAVVDRRFDRAHYDALRTVDEFGARLRDEVDPDAVSVDLQHTVQDAMAPRLVGLWLRGAQ